MLLHVVQLDFGLGWDMVTGSAARAWELGNTQGFGHRQLEALALAMLIGLHLP